MSERSSRKYFAPLVVRRTVEVEALLQSKEAKFYLGHMQHQVNKLENFFKRELTGNAVIRDINVLLDERDAYIDLLQTFLDKNVPTWRSEFDEFHSNDNGDSG